jgi:hypothetical protein
MLDRQGDARTVARLVNSVLRPLADTLPAPETSPTPDVPPAPDVPRSLRDPAMLATRPTRSSAGRSRPSWSGPRGSPAHPRGVGLGSRRTPDETPAQTSTAEDQETIPLPGPDETVTFEPVFREQF